MRCKLYLAGQLGKYPDIPDECLRLYKRCLFLKRLKIVLGDVKHLLHIVGALQKQQIPHIPREIIDKLRQLPALIYELAQYADGACHILVEYAP